MFEARDAAVRTLASPDTKDLAEIARLQQEIGTLTMLIGDDKSVYSLRDYMHDELLAFLQAQDEAQENNG